MKLRTERIVLPFLEAAFHWTIEPMLFGVGALERAVLSLQEEFRSPPGWEEYWELLAHQEKRVESEQAAE